MRAVDEDDLAAWDKGQAEEYRRTWGRLLYSAPLLAVILIAAGVFFGWKYGMSAR
ncbi:MAG TPA: hypothetical protein VHD55_03475 [Candidatus Paceibacterota bacterium]|nr:hypothetical protein [Candidatus Paceibacterota bacterium]